MLSLTSSQIATLISTLSATCDEAPSQFALENRIGEDITRRALDLHSELLIQFGSAIYDVRTMEMILDET